MSDHPSRRLEGAVIDRRVFLAVAGVVTAGPRIAHAQNVAKRTT
jgi:hypothetical protein